MEFGPCGSITTWITPGKNRGKKHLLSTELETIPNSRGKFDIKATTADFRVDPSVPPGPDREYYTDPDVKRRADVYVFCSYPEEDTALVDPLNVAKWEFYVLSTREIEQHFGSQDTGALSRIQAIGAARPSRAHKRFSSLRNKNHY